MDCHLTAQPPSLALALNNRIIRDAEPILEPCCGPQEPFRTGRE